MIKKRARKLILMLSLMLMGVFLLYLQLRNNIHTVSPGQLYRSAQLSMPELRHIILKDHIRTIINLRGRNAGDPWYQNERHLSSQMGVQHFDLRWSSYRVPAPVSMQQLVQLYQTVPEPILIHCKGGADRTGLAAAVWLLMHGAPLSRAIQAFSFRYHVIRHDSVGRLTLPLYAAWLHQRGLHSSSAHFLTWVKQGHYGVSQ